MISVRLFILYYFYYYFAVNVSALSCYFVLIYFLFWPVNLSLKNINMSFSVDHIISIIDNNGPKPRSCVKFPCGICNKTVKKNHKAIQCDSCDLWVYIGCNGVSDMKYGHLKTDLNPWMLS